MTDRQTDLTEHFEKNEMISPVQFGCRKYHSTTHALTYINDFILNKLDNKQFCILVALDIRKAFDIACRDLLIHKLKWYGVNCEVLNSFLKDRTQYVCNCGDDGKLLKSAMLDTNVGIPQGLCLSCWLFLIIMNDLPLHVRYALIAMFVDDTSLICAGCIEDVDIVIQGIEADLNSIVLWMNNNRLQLNASKCEYMVLSKECLKDRLSCVSISMNGSQLKRTSVIKMLGVTIDDKLAYDKHTAIVQAKCYGVLSSLYPLKNVLSYDNKTMVVKALIFPIFMYACSTWLLRDSNRKVIDRIIKSCARFVANTRKGDPISDLLNITLNGCLLATFVILKLLRWHIKLLLEDAHLYL